MKLFICLAILLCLTVSCHADCQLMQVRACIDKYKAELKELPDENSHCRRLKDVVKCFWAENPDCLSSGNMINRWRGWVLMVATLEKFLDMCPIEEQTLRGYYSKLPDDSPFSNTAKGIYRDLLTDGISDSDKKCARDLHVRCNSEFVKAAINDAQICEDGGKWLNCYKNNDCDQKSAIVRYASYTGKLASFLVPDCQRDS